MADAPRVFHILVESSNLAWSFTVEEAVFGTQAGTAKAPQESASRLSQKSTCTFSLANRAVIIDVGSSHGPPGMKASL